MTPDKISKLGREEKTRLLGLIRERKRRLRDRQEVYTPNEGQIQVHRSHKKLRCVFSGNGAGKTALAVNEVIWACQGYNPITETFTRVPATVVVLLDHPEKVEDLWLPELMKWTIIKEDQLKKRGKPYVNQIVFPNGSKINFMFHQQEPMIFESIELDVLVADEPPPRQAYVALRRGARKKGRKPRFLIVGTPISCPWMRTEIFEPWRKGEPRAKDTDCFRFGTIVNEKNLAEGYIDDFSTVLTEKEKGIRLHGEFFDLSGLALAHLFDPDRHVIDPEEWDPAWPCVIAIDPHTSKPHHACLVGCDKDGKLHYMYEMKKKKVAREFAREVLLKWYAPFSVIDVVCDSLGSSDYTSGEGFKSFIKVCNEEGLPVRATRWAEKSDEDFIQRIRDLLYVDPVAANPIPKIFIWRHNRGIIRDIENAQFQKHRNIDMYKDKLDIENKDFLSTLKYALACNLSFENTNRSPIYRYGKGKNPYGTTMSTSQVVKRKPKQRAQRLRRNSVHFDEFGDETLNPRRIIKYR